MEEKTINELIQQLTQNLQNVESARQQVENSVKAYNSLREEVSKYTTELSFIAQNVRTMISQLEEIKEKFLGNIAAGIVEEIHNAITTITHAIERISSQLSSLYDLTDSKTELISNNVQQRADFIDSALSSIRNEISTIDTKVVSVKTLLVKIETDLQSVKDEELKHYNAVVKQLKEQEERFNNEFNVARKQNMVFSVVIIVLLLVLIGLLTYFKGVI